MDTLNESVRELIGKRSSFDIYSHDGRLLVPALNIITYDQALLLQKEGISVEIDEMETIEETIENHRKTIDETVDEIKDIFGGIRRTKEIPIAHIREEIVPNIHLARESYHVLRLFTALQAKDDYTYRHNMAVGALSNLIGTWMELDEQELLQLTMAGLLHDVGKMAIPKEILNKPGPLTDEEFEEMKRHTIYGYEMLKNTVGISHRQALVALQHHERVDGTGYPFHLKKGEIDLFSRIVAVADVFHAMSSNRVYQDRSPFFEVLAEMEQEMYGKLDPEITYLFIEQTMYSLIGSKVLLTDGREGTIVLVPSNDPTKPLIKLENGFVNLRMEKDLGIDQIIE